jgi:hypothetical protein
MLTLQPTCFDENGVITEEFEKQRVYDAALERRYPYAAAHPWLAAEADPPEPR